MGKQNISALYNKISGIIESARAGVARSVDTVQVVSNWLIGREIIEDEQNGSRRADYGARVLEGLAVRLKDKYGPGYSLQNLRYFRQFYLTFQHLLSTEQIRHAVRGESKAGKIVPLTAIRNDICKRSWQPGYLNQNLCWLSYRTLLKVEEFSKRSFYEIEATKNHWAARELERQINTQLYERLALSRDKKGVLALAKHGQIIQQPIDILKEPVVLEFMDLPESERLNETKLERALISKLQAFLLELGQGFAFVGRQKRLTLDGDHFYPDLVFYHIKLKCYVIIELKTGKLTHGDMGQMLMYVNYYDREVAGAADNSTIGLMLCTEKNDTVVKYVLDEKKKRIFASRYKTCLPSEEKLRAELRRELDTLPLTDS